MQKPIRSAAILAAVLFCLANGLTAGDATPPQPVNPWIGPGSPFVFSEGNNGERLVKIGNLEYWILTPDQLASNPNPGLANRNVAIIGNLGRIDDDANKRFWSIQLANDKTIFTHGPNAYEENLDMVRGLRIGYEVMLVGQAKPTADQKGSILVVTKPYHIPAEIDRNQAEFENIQQTHPDYDTYKRMADDLAIKADKARKANNEHLAGQFTDLRDTVVNELLSIRAAVLNGGQLTVPEMFEYLATIIKYTDDRPRAAEVLKRIMKKDPDNPKIIEPQRSLLPDWVKCAEAKAWMAKADCDKLRQAALAELERQRQAQIERDNQKLAAAAMNSNLRHVVAVKHQAVLVAAGNKLPAANSAEFKELAKTLGTTDDYRLVQELALETVAQVEPKEWVRLIEPMLANPNPPIRLLAYRLGAYSKDLVTVKRLALALRIDNSDMVKEDAVMAMCETRAKPTVQALADCMINSSDDQLNSALLTQLQLLTNRRDTDKESWQKYVSTPDKIVVIPE